MPTYKIIYDITQDAFNWYSAIVEFGQGKKLKDPADQGIIKQISGLDFQAAKEVVKFTSEKT